MLYGTWPHVAPALKRSYVNIQALLMKEDLMFVCFGFYVTLTQYRSYGDVPALLVEEDLRCPSVHYFRHLSRTTAPTFHKLAG
jgi:hypothetical protein